jgi:RNA polymerase sigma-70 factor (ECF subfamily)
MTSALSLQHSFSVRLLPGDILWTRVAFASLPIQELLEKCTHAGPQAAWEELVRRTQPVLRASIWRTCVRYGLDTQKIADDLLQEAYLKVADPGLLAKFIHQESDAIFRFLKVVATNVVTDHARNGEAACRSLKATVRLEPDMGRTETHIASEQRLLLEQIDGILGRRLQGKSSARDRCIFWLYYRHGLTAGEIGSLDHIRLGKKGAESVICRLTKLVRESIARRTRIAGAHVSPSSPSSEADL